MGTELYFDPHLKHDTGEQNRLKGWCSKIRFADKILPSDFIHTAQSAPIYFETTDNFADLQERFFGVVQRARATLGWPADRRSTQASGIFWPRVSCSAAPLMSTASSLASSSGHLEPIRPPWPRSSTHAQSPTSRNSTL